MELFNLSASQALEQVSSRKDGLTEKEAAERLEREGANRLTEAKKKPAALKILSQFADPMIIVLLVAAAVSAVFAIINAEYADLIDSGIILLIVIINAVIGFVQENRAENALEALKAVNRPFSKVIREGELKTVPAEQLVVGDVVVLEAGDVVPADLRLLSSASLKCEESALTGESLPAEKDAEALCAENTPVGDRKNCAFSGSTVTYGRGSGVVYATGMNTQTGAIAKMLSEAEEAPSPLSRQLAKTAKILSVAVLAVALVIFIVAVCRREDIATAFMTSVAIAVAAIPEGLPAVVTIVLAMGMQKMSKQNAIVKNLPAVETLGCCQVICSDKTGTLTLNKMTVKDAYCPSNDKNTLMRIMALCNDTVETPEGLAGDPTETALVDCFISNGGDYAALNAKFPRIDERPFDSVRKLMTTVHADGGSRFACTKGAPDMLIARCTRILTPDGVRDITEEDIKEVYSANSDMAGRALRVLAAAYREDGNACEEDMIFVGLVGMIDPPRKEVKAAVAKCRRAGIKPIMITGDHPDTACAIAKELDILREGDLTATGAELDQMTDEYLTENILKYSVFARVSPENKVRIVKALRALGKVCAMTGDGVNDAPSIKEADIGIGMGITGTQVSKQAADVVLTDDNFATIVGAVEEGRKIYSNITKAIQFLLSANIAEVLCLFIASVILDVQFLTPVMLLWVNLVTDSFPALSLGAERAEKNVMEKQPRKSNSSLFAGATGRDIIIQGIMQTCLVMLAFCLGNYVLPDGAADHGVPMTMAFVSLCFIQLFHSFNLRSQGDSILNRDLFSNKYLNLSALLGVALTLAVILIPALSGIFRTASLTWVEWLISVGVAFAIIPLVELQKFIQKRIKKIKSA
ncbi:MAG: calcium-translocating P-type ATPase, PMCA-type [Candidatus Coproplasma sp.]